MHCTRRYCIGTIHLFEDARRALTHIQSSPTALCGMSWEPSKLARRQAFRSVEEQSITQAASLKFEREYDME
jgi:hypothetical protein